MKVTTMRTWFRVIFWLGIALVVLNVGIAIFFRNAGLVFWLNLSVAIILVVTSSFRLRDVRRREARELAESKDD